VKARRACRSPSNGRLLVAYGMNGEAVRPQTIPMRLMVPASKGSSTRSGCSGIKLVDRYYMNYNGLWPSRSG